MAEHETTLEEVDPTLIILSLAKFSEGTNKRGHLGGRVDQDRDPLEKVVFYTGCEV